MKIEILCTGDEILSGKTVNTNYSYMARRLVENGFTCHWGTVVGDDRESLVSSFSQASERADIVIVNGGLGPTVDDLSQEVAASAAGVELELHEAWLSRIASWYQKRGRIMPENNTKQAMLPGGAEFIDNPIGTACGFTIDIGQARFYFTPGVPNEMRRMLEEQIIPRLQAYRGEEMVTRIKRFHTFGIGESRADRLLDGVEAMSDDGSVKLGFQSHYPQLETKLTSQARTRELLEGKMAAIELALRSRLGNFIVSEDDETLEQRVSNEIVQLNGEVVVFETGTAGKVATRLMSVGSDSRVIKSAYVGNDVAELSRISGVNIESSQDLARLARAIANQSLADRIASHALVILTQEDEASKSGGVEFSSNEYAWEIVIVVADKHRVEVRQSKLPGSAEWIRTGATELALDCLRRFLTGLPVQERIDFEQH